MSYIKTSTAIIILLGSIIILLSQCINGAEAGNDPRGRNYAGAATCKQCHRAVYDSYVNTAHFNTTSEPTAEKIRGSFTSPHNSFTYDSVTQLIMEKRDSGYFQVVYKRGKETAAHRFDILFGYRNAQTSIFWKDDQPHELPLSYYASVNQWATSPGFPIDHPKFDRYVGTECLDCHSSGINLKANASLLDEERLDRSTLILGIDCERCHGPALNHVNFHTANPEEKIANYIIKNSQLTRQQKLDACAVCHSGNDQMKIQSRFLFKMGDTLSYFFMPYGSGKSADIDVHGNQYRLLRQSKCFKGNTITCANCHDPHKDATESIAMYSQKCMSCHNAEANDFCPKYAVLGESIKTNCIDCHMPKQGSTSISFQTQGSSTIRNYLLRTHKIGIYDSARQAGIDKENRGH